MASRLPRDINLFFDRSGAAARPVVIDTDPGADDAQAISMMLSADRRGEVRVLALSVTFGNSTVKHCTRNARRVLSVCNRLDVSAACGNCEVSGLF